MPQIRSAAPVIICNYLGGIGLQNPEKITGKSGGIGVQIRGYRCAARHLVNAYKGEGPRAAAEKNTPKFYPWRTAATEKNNVKIGG